MDTRMRAAPALTFGEVVSELGFQGCTQDGWLCPCCWAPNGLKESTDHYTGTCVSCDITVDRLSIIMVARNRNVAAAAETLLDFYKKRGRA